MSDEIGKEDSRVNRIRVPCRRSELEICVVRVCVSNNRRQSPDP
jgi:hypothetical protein